ncbi:MAG: DUF4838 domain-containing protein [Bacteroidales bacterium]|nr:DUF4838 domain-containing protein [Bacteroidales bacterium]
MKKSAPIFLFFLLWLGMSWAQKPIVFSQNDDYVIVVDKNKSGSSLEAAQELAHFLEKIFNRPYQIVSDQDYKGKHAICVGRNKLSESVFRKYTKQIRDDGFLLHSDGQNLYIFGNEPVADLYGVYHLLENYLGCSYTASRQIHFEPLPDEVVLHLHDLQNPSFRYRETLHLIPNEDPLYARWHKLHNRADFNREWGMFVHTFQHLIPVSDYFETHPEWFSEMHGQRVRDGQLCLSNPAVLEELCRNLGERMKKEPEKKIWSVSQNDNESSCTCPHCLHLDSLYGGPSGTMIWFVNQVAARFPDKVISTLAYQQTRHAPKDIRPADNVNIMLCSIECPRQHPMSTDTSVRSFQRDLDDWCRLTHNIFLWDYVVQFRNYQDPFPNLHVIQPNLQNFCQHQVPMVFEQGSGSNITENYEWRTYLIAHLLWNVNLDVDSLRDRFLETHYGEDRAIYIKQYYETMQQALLDSKQPLNIYGYPVDAKDGYLSPVKFDYYRSLFAEAYRRLPYEDCPKAEVGRYNDRLRLLELSLDFAELDLSMYEYSPRFTYFTQDGAGEKQVRPEMISLLEKFVVDCERLGVKQLDEAKYTPQQLYDNVMNFVKKSTGKNWALGKPVTCSTEWSTIYDVGGPKALTDGHAGMMNYHYRWLGFQGQDMDVVIDLENVREVSEIRADYLFYPLSWIFVPKKVTCYVSENQVEWKEVAQKTYANEESLAECKIVDFDFTFAPVNVRYVRVKAESLRVNPEWHRGVGQPCWIFCDEIVVK